MRRKLAFNLRLHCRPIHPQTESPPAAPFVSDLNVERVVSYPSGEGLGVGADRDPLDRLPAVVDQKLLLRRVRIPVSVGT
jgi:hypothetical protein